MNSAFRTPIRSFLRLESPDVHKERGPTEEIARTRHDPGNAPNQEQRVSTAAGVSGVCLQFWRWSPIALWMVFDMAINPGEMAPDFTLTSHTGSPVTLSDLRGAPVVLAFHPASFTGG